MRGGSQSMVNLQNKFKELFKELTGGEINKKNLPVNQKNLPGILMEINEVDYATIKPIVLQMYGKVRWVEKAFKDAKRKKKEMGKERKAAEKEFSGVDSQKTQEDSPSTSDATKAAAPVLTEEEQAAIDDQLCNAAEKGDSAEVRRLAGEGASVDAKNEDGDPAVVLAAVGGHVDVVEDLLRLGCDPNARDEYGCTALMHAAEGVGGAPEYLYLKTVEVLLKHIGSQIGGVVHRKRVMMDAVDDDGMTALMWAALEGEEKVVSLLLKAGAEVNLRATSGEYEGKTALEIVDAIVLQRAGRGMGRSGWTKIKAELEGVPHRGKNP